MTKPFVTIELDEYNKLIKQSNSIPNLLHDLGINVNILESPSIVNNYNFLHEVTIEKRKIKEYLIKKYDDLNIINVKFKEVKQ